MRIAYLSGAYIPDRGADSVHVMSMCQALVQTGHHVQLYARQGAESASDDFDFYGVSPCFRIVKVARPQVRVLGALVNAWLVAARVKRDEPDLIYAREFYALALAVSSGRPFVYEVHWKPRHAGERAALRWIFRQPGLRRLVFISARLRDLYLEEFPWLERDKLLVAHDAANTVAELPAEPVPARSSRLQVGYVGGFLPGYGIEVIVELARRRSDLDFHVVGGREPAVREWRLRTATLTNLTFYGFVPPSQLGEHYRSFDVVLAPYQPATPHIDWISPMKLFEYMAHGKAIICANFPVMREILQDEQDALLVAATDVNAYDRALTRLSDTAIRTRLGQRARAKLESEFTWRARAQTVLSGITLTVPPSAPNVAGGY
jgi:glycosyltransferase involved in cell wall biosynthesis